MSPSVVPDSAIVCHLTRPGAPHLCLLKRGLFPSEVAGPRGELLLAQASVEFTPRGLPIFEALRCLSEQNCSSSRQGEPGTALKTYHGGLLGYPKGQTWKLGYDSYFPQSAGAPQQTPGRENTRSRLLCSCRAWKQPQPVKRRGGRGGVYSRGGVLQPCGPFRDEKTPDSGLAAREPSTSPIYLNSCVSLTVIGF